MELKGQLFFLNKTVPVIEADNNSQYDFPLRVKNKNNDYYKQKIKPTMSWQVKRRVKQKNKSPIQCIIMS